MKTKMYDRIFGCVSRKGILRRDFKVLQSSSVFFHISSSTSFSSFPPFLIIFHSLVHLLPCAFFIIFHSLVHLHPCSFYLYSYLSPIFSFTIGLTHQISPPPLLLLHIIHSLSFVFTFHLPSFLHLPHFFYSFNLHIHSPHFPSLSPLFYSFFTHLFSFTRLLIHLFLSCLFYPAFIHLHPPIPLYRYFSSLHEKYSPAFDMSVTPSAGQSSHEQVSPSLTSPLTSDEAPYDYDDDIYK